MDVSLPAFRHKSFPLSVGIRTQTQRLHFITPETNGSFLKTGISRDEGGLRMWRQIETLGPSGPNHDSSFSVFIGEGPSLLYSPFFVEKELLFDGVLGKSLGRLDPPLDPGETGDLFPPGEAWERGFRFLPVLCPDCGNDLSGEKGSVILFCRGCNSAMQPSSGGFRNVPVGRIPGTGEGVLSLPFWKMKIRSASLGLLSQADLVKKANLPGPFRKSWIEQPCTLWSPAFRISPALFLRLTRQMMLAPSSEEIDPGLPQSPVYPVTLRSEQAAEGVRVHIVNMTVADKVELISKLAGVPLDPEEETLVYVPFLEKGGDLIHYRLNFSIPKAALALQTPWG
jgi:ribosomal protein S27E